MTDIVITSEAQFRAHLNERITMKRAFFIVAKPMLNGRSIVRLSVVWPDA